MFALINIRIFDFQDYIEFGYIVFNEKIVEVGDMESFVDKGYEITDGTGHMVMPSLTVAHTHLYSTFARGMDVPFNPNSFQEILDQLWWKLDSHLNEEDIYYSGLTAAAEYAKNGVTSIIDHHASKYIRGSLEQLKKSFEKIGIRGLFCFETSDRFTVEDCIDENQQSGDMFGLHASMSLSDETLKKVKNKLGNKPIHIHAAESWFDQESTMSYHGERVVERLNRFGLLNKGSILAHCTHINENEADLIAKNGCYVALNVQSNMNNAVGLPDFKMLEAHGVQCLIGNDGMSTGITGEWLSLMLSMKHKYLSPTAFGLIDLLRIIDNNYNYINNALGIKTGRLKRDFDADLLMIQYNPPTPAYGCNMLGHIVFGLGSNFKPSDVWCRGRRIVKNYRNNPVIDIEIKKARESAGKLWKRINGEKTYE